MSTVPIPDCIYCNDAPEGCDTCNPVKMEIVPTRQTDQEHANVDDHYRDPEDFYESMLIDPQ